MKETDLWFERFRKLWQNLFDQLDDILKPYKPIKNHEERHCNYQRPGEQKA